MNSVVFLGGGRITGALVAGLRHAGFRGRIVVYDRHAEKLRQLRNRYAAHAQPELRRAVRQAGLLLIAVRPPDVLPLLARIAASGPRTVAMTPPALKRPPSATTSSTRRAGSTSAAVAAPWIRMRS